MLRISKGELNLLEKQYPGIKASILRFEEATLPACSHCGSENTADVQCGVIGRTIYIAGATTKFKLIPNPPKPGRYFCNACERFFGATETATKKKSGKKGEGVTLCLKGRSLEAYKDFVNGIAKGLLGDRHTDTRSEEAWVRDWKAFWAEGGEEDEKEYRERVDKAAYNPDE